MDISVESDIEQVRKKLGAMGKEVLPKAVASTLNRIAQKVQTQAVKEIARRTGIKQKDVRAVFWLKRASWAAPEAVVTATGRTYNLIRLGAKKSAHGVSAKAWGKKIEVKGAFIVNNKWVAMRNAQKFGYMANRRGRSKHSEGIGPVYGPSVPRSFASEHIMQPLQKMVSEEFIAELERQIDFYLSRYK